jgi:hypothetical protein
VRLRLASTPAAALVAQVIPHRRCEEAQPTKQSRAARRVAGPNPGLLRFARNDGPLLGFARSDGNGLNCLRRTAVTARGAPAARINTGSATVEHGHSPPSLRGGAADEAIQGGSAGCWSEAWIASLRPQ